MQNQFDAKVEKLKASGLGTTRPGLSVESDGEYGITRSVYLETTIPPAEARAAIGAWLALAQEVGGYFMINAGNSYAARNSFSLQVLEFGHEVAA